MGHLEKLHTDFMNDIRQHFKQTYEKYHYTQASNNNLLKMESDLNYGVREIIEKAEYFYLKRFFDADFQVNETGNANLKAKNIPTFLFLNNITLNVAVYMDKEISEYVYTDDEMTEVTISRTDETISVSKKVNIPSGKTIDEVVAELNGEEHKTHLEKLKEKYGEDAVIRELTLEELDAKIAEMQKRNNETNSSDK